MTKTLKRVLLMSLLAPVIALAVPFQEGVISTNGPFVEGKDYKTLSIPNKIKDTTTIEVKEFFYYGCGHCFAFEKPVNSWKKNIGSDVVFNRTPVVFGRDQWKVLARAYHTAKAMGVLPLVHGPIFDALHVHKKSLASKDKVADFFASLGVDRSKFLATYDSLGITAKVANGEKLTANSQITGVPSIVVNGKYLTSSTMAGSSQRVFAVINYLIAEERKLLNQ